MLDIPPVEKQVYDDLVENQKTIAAALAEFDVSSQAVTVEITPGTPTDQKSK